MLDQTWQSIRDLAETVSCPECQAVIGVTCRRKGGGDLAAPAHAPRIRKAAKTQAQEKK